VCIYLMWVWRMCVCVCVCVCVEEYQSLQAWACMCVLRECMCVLRECMMATCNSRTHTHTHTHPIGVAACVAECVAVYCSVLQCLV